MLIIGIIIGFSATGAYATGHMIWSYIQAAITVVCILVAVSCEGTMLNRIKKLEEEIKILKRGY